MGDIHPSIYGAETRNHIVTDKGIRQPFIQFNGMLRGWNYGRLNTTGLIFPLTIVCA